MRVLSFEEKCKGGGVRTHKRSEERGVAVYITAVLLVMAVPMIGLTFDATFMFLIKAKLQASVDGAALVGARSLSRGSDDTAQKTAAANSAVAYVKLNYPGSFFFSGNVTVDPVSDVNIDLSVPNQRTITVTAHVTAPAMFMRFLNFSSTNINASAQTVRKDVNVVLVLDRSGSMTASGSCNPMKQAAINFVNNFAEGRDNLGLVTFSTSTDVNFPISNTNFKAQTSTAINTVVCNGSTSSAAGLWYAYDQLVGLNQPAALNFIVFFTDGEPTGEVMDMPLVSTPGHCNAGTPGPATLRGLFATFVDNSHFIALANQTPKLNPDGTQDFSNGDNYIAANSAGCVYAPNWNLPPGQPANWQNQSDFVGLPTTDIYGNSLNTTYKALTPLVGGYIDINQQANGIPAATNAADDAARRIRIGTVETFPNNYGRGLDNVIIDSIGLGNAPVPLPADGIFLSRVSNTSNSQTYDSTKPTGLYVYAQQSTDISGAFSQIASEILRLAK